MTATEYAELRQIVDRCLDGTERPQDVGARFFVLMAQYWEANYQASRRGEGSLLEFPVKNELSAEEKLRMVALFEASFDKSRPQVE
jgi:hypothetical protein